MRIGSLFFALLLGLSSYRAEAGMVTFDFSSLAADVGNNTAMAEVVSGAFTAYIYDFTPYRAVEDGGQIGIVFGALGSTGGMSITLSNGAFGIPFLLDGVEATFAASTSSHVHEEGTTDNDNVVLWDWNNTFTGIQTETFVPTSGPISMPYLNLNPYADDEGLLVTFTIDVVPEPSSAILLSIGTLVGLAHRRIISRR